MKLVALGMMVIGCATLALAGHPYGAPETDPAMGVGALALLGGGLMILRARGKK